MNERAFYDILIVTWFALNAEEGWNLRCKRKRGAK